MWTGWKLNALAGNDPNDLVSICSIGGCGKGEKHNIITGSHCHRKRTRIIAKRSRKGTF